MSPAPEGFREDEDVQGVRRTLVTVSPIMGGDAYLGLVGDIVRVIEPHTEADPVGVLMSLLTMFGASVGAGPHASADGSQHPARLFALLVGPTAKARKGTATSHARRIFDHADPDFTAGRILNGFGSGEILVDNVADPDEEGNGGANDKRLLLVEPEFPRLLRVSNRDGSTLSPIIREAWDGGRLAARSRQRTTVATGAHISILGHSTAEELRRYLTDTDQANGFANRFVVAFVRRSKRLPHGGNLADADVAELGRQMRDVLHRARRIGRVRRSIDADLLWTDLYDQMADDDPGGLLGAVVARPEAQTLRLSVTYALLDGSSTIEVEHLRAAWAVWTYCRQSAEVIFGDAQGDPVADKLLAAIAAAGTDGLDFTQQSIVFGGHEKAARLSAARRQLEESGQVVTETIPTAGRPLRITRACEESGTSETTSSRKVLPLPPLSSHGTSTYDLDEPA